MARRPLPRGLARAVRILAFPVLQTELVAGYPLMRAESTLGVARTLTGVFLTVERRDLDIPNRSVYMPSVASTRVTASMPAHDGPVVVQRSRKELGKSLELS